MSVVYYVVHLIAGDFTFYSKWIIPFATFAAIAYRTMFSAIISFLYFAPTGFIVLFLYAVALYLKPHMASRLYSIPLAILGAAAVGLAVVLQGVSDTAEQHLDTAATSIMIVGAGMLFLRSKGPWFWEKALEP